MPRYFMRDTPLEKLEREMMEVPGFNHREDVGSIIIQLPLYTHSDFNPFVQSFFVHDFLESLPQWARQLWPFVQNVPAIAHRLKASTQNSDRMFLDDDHVDRYHAASKMFLPYSFENVASRESMGARFLLTAYPSVWEKVAGYISEGQIDFSRVRVGSLTCEQYAVYQAAKSFIGVSKNITIEDFASPELIPNEAFQLIAVALSLATFDEAMLMEHFGNTTKE